MSIIQSVLLGALQGLAEFLPISEKPEKVAGVVPARDHHDLTDPCIGECLNWVINHGRNPLAF